MMDYNWIQRRGKMLQSDRCHNLIATFPLFPDAPSDVRAATPLSLRPVVCSRPLSAVSCWALLVQAPLSCNFYLGATQVRSGLHRHRPMIWMNANLFASIFSAFAGWYPAVPTSDRLSPSLIDGHHRITWLRVATGLAPPPPLRYSVAGLRAIVRAANW
ncbi:hypothetical protein HYPSUDRAFT_397170 [Hypholoma sublateritium FD-334 SS-4]|uniref:Uncharacterized protein n=1 Tax=Hypholoma sublateritium (strain FD-334 SS-4) TaxID=945553 RepID=A0A0D2LWE6_HYPSF|nr:hypothetical protein HYPSUDRAFT_397170 [Hypholoma sublateritium FD-334 SS-4]